MQGPSGLKLLRKNFECVNISSEFGLFQLNQMFLTRLQKRDDALTIQYPISLIKKPAESLDYALDVFVSVLFFYKEVRNLSLLPGIFARHH